MRSKLLLRICIAPLLFFCLMDTAHAQCTNRYLDSTSFTAIDSFENIIYTTTAGGGVDTELLDVYQPHGDTACLRHLIIWMHGGAFFQGSKNDGDIDFLCHHMAQRGYVCASINYRLASSLVDLYDSAQIFKYAYYGFSDMKAAIRYFYKDASEGNHWNIDTAAIFIGGSSAGGIDADFVASLDSIDQLAPPFQTIASANGGIDGNSGNAGYSTKLIGVASLAGAVNSVNWINPNTPPTVFCQGTADGTVPYYYGLALTQYTLGLYPTIYFAGSGDMVPRFDSLGIRNSLLSFPGSGHVPWDTNATIMYRTDSAVATFFYSINCTQTIGHCSEPSGVVRVSDDADLSIYPNPANEYAGIRSRDGSFLETIYLCDYTGREIWREDMDGSMTAQVPVKGLPPGIYLLRIYLAGPDDSVVLRKLVID